MQKFLAGSLAVNFVDRSCFYRYRDSRLYRPLSLFFVQEMCSQLIFHQSFLFLSAFPFFFFPILFAVQGGHFRYVTGDTTMAWTVAPS